MDLILAYVAGLLTLINPCVLPVLPIVLASSLGRHRAGPVALAAGMAASFTIFGFAFAALGPALGLDEDVLLQAGAVLMLGFGLVLLAPPLQARFQAATAGFAARADAGIDTTNTMGLPGQALGGVLLGAAWSPCIGPTLGGAIALASQGEDLMRAFAIMLMFSAGVASVMLALAYGLRGVLARNRARAAALARRARPLMGAVFVLVALAILTGALQGLEGLAVTYLPYWLQDLSISL
jgi:cytochrome c-type biogenesis protein